MSAFLCKNIISQSLLFLKYLIKYNLSELDCFPANVMQKTIQESLRVFGGVKNESFF